LTPTPQVTTAIRWFEDTQIKPDGHAPADFLTRYDPDQMPEWSSSRELMNVYMVRNTHYQDHLDALSDLELERIGKIYNYHKVQIAINDASAWYAHYESGGAEPNFQESIDMIQRLLDAGWDVNYVLLDRVLSKYKLDPQGQPIPYDMVFRIADAVSYAQQVIGAFPDLELGIICALPTNNYGYPTGWKVPYQDLKDALTLVGYTWDVYLLDMPFSKVPSGDYAFFNRIQNFINNTIGAQFGMYVTDTQGGMNSSTLFRKNVLNGMNNYMDENPQPDYCVLGSWFYHPQNMLPEAPVLTNPTLFGIFRELEMLLDHNGL
jgi:hypothetical protein